MKEEYREVTLIISEKAYLRAEALLHPAAGDDHLSIAGEFSHTMVIDEFLAMALEDAIEAIDTGKAIA